MLFLRTVLRLSTCCLPTLAMQSCNNQDAATLDGKHKKTKKNNDTSTDTTSRVSPPNNNAPAQTGYKTKTTLTKAVTDKCNQLTLFLEKGTETATQKNTANFLKALGIDGTNTIGIFMNAANNVIQPGWGGLNAAFTAMLAKLLGKKYNDVTKADWVTHTDPATKLPYCVLPKNYGYLVHNLGKEGVKGGKLDDLYHYQKQQYLDFFGLAVRKFQASGKKGAVILLPTLSCDIFAASFAGTKTVGPFSLEQFLNLIYKAFGDALDEASKKNDTKQLFTNDDVKIIIWNPLMKDKGAKMHRFTNLDEVQKFTLKP